jgi:hypothetical protein
MFNKIVLSVGLKFFFKPMRLLDLVVEFVLKIILSELIVQCVIIIFKHGFYTLFVHISLFLIYFPLLYNKQNFEKHKKLNLKKLLLIKKQICSYQIKWLSKNVWTM